MLTLALPRPTKPGPRAATPDKDRARDLFTELYAEHALLVTRTATAVLHPDHQGLADDLAQDVWLDTWQHLLNGNTVHDPAQFLIARTRRLAEAGRLTGAAA